MSDDDDAHGEEEEALEGVTPLREGGALLGTYNEGLVVFLYDEAHVEEIERAAPEVLEGFNEEIGREPALVELARSGRLLVYELWQDDCLCTEVVVGSPLGDEELATARWLPPQRSPLSLPSGTLRVETYDSLRVGPAKEDAEEPGAEVEVPPGEYVASLYRQDWRNEDCEIDETRPREVIVLTPAGEAGPVPDVRGVLSADEG